MFQNHFLDLRGAQNGREMSAQDLDPVETLRADPHRRAFGDWPAAWLASGPIG